MADSKNTPRSVLCREQAARNGDPGALPDKLKPMQIAALEYPDDPDGGNARFQFCSALQKAIDRDELKTSGQTDDIYLKKIPQVAQRPLISRADYRQFLELIGVDPSPGVAAWMNGAIQALAPENAPDEPAADLVSPLPDSKIVESPATAGRNPDDPDKKEQRMEAIRGAFTDLGYHILNPPYGGIKEIKNRLEKTHPELFTSKSFGKNCTFDKALQALRESEEGKTP